MNICYWKSAREYLERFIYVNIGFFFLCFFVTGFFYQASLFRDTLARIDSDIFLSSVFIIAGYALLIRAFASQWFKDLPDRIFLPATLILFGALHVIILLPWRFQVRLDFLGMHQIATTMAAKPLGDVLNTINGFFPERVIFYLYPAYKLFGPGPVTFKALNIFMLLVCGLCLYRCCRAIFSRRVARVILVMLFAVPARYFYVNLPTHDISGLFYLGLFFFSYVMAWQALEARRTARLVAWSVAMGLCIFLAGVARTLYIHLVFSLALVAGLLVVNQLPTINTPASRRRIVRFVLLFLVVPALIGKAGIGLVGRHQTNLNTTSILFMGNASSGNGAFAEICRLREYTNLMPEKAVSRRYSIGRLCSEFHYNCQSLMRMFKRKTELLHYPSGELGFVSHTADGKPWQIPPGLGALFNMAPLINNLLGIAGILWLLKRRPNFKFLIFYAFALVSTGTFLLGEVQPRYTYVNHFFYAMTAGIGIAGLSELGRGGRTYAFAYRRRVAFQIAAFALFMLLLLTAGRSAADHLIQSTDYLFVDLSKPLSVRTNGLPPQPAASLFLDVTPIEQRPFTASFKLPAVPGGRIDATWPWRLNPGRKYRLQAFVNAPDSKIGPVDLMLHAAGQPVAAICSENLPALRFITSQPFVATAAQTTLTLTLERPQSAARTAMAEGNVQFEYVMLTEVP